MDFYRCKASFYRRQEVGGKTLLGKDGTTASLFYPDIADENMSTEELLCLGVGGEAKDAEISQPPHLYGREVESSSLAMGLVPEEDAEAKQQYKRKGLAHWVKRSLLESRKPCSIRLI
ncbi:MAG: hypothetical protein L6R42_010016 [Xanthoria sp. 1 TBL-2021]|nr:MAG: hypothetical protein L6R42_010016 [Xanthoria sp. 1 TBL-2021]